MSVSRKSMFENFPDTRNFSPSIRDIIELKFNLSCPDPTEGNGIASDNL